MLDVSELKVFEFESGETECVIARNYEEACNFYKNYIDEDSLDWSTITEIKDWKNKIVRCETDEKQEDGTYWENKTMEELAREFYQNGYTGATIISTTVI